MLSRTHRRSPFPIRVDSVHLPAIFLVATVCAYVTYGQVIYFPHPSTAQSAIAYTVVSALALCGARLSYSHAPSAFRILTRAVIAFALFYVLASHVEIADSLVAGDALAAFEFKMFWIIAALCGAIGFFRPSFGLVPIAYIPWQKHQLSSLFGLPIDWMDHFALVETGSFLILGYLLFVALCRCAPALDPGTDDASERPAVRNPLIGTLHPVDVLVLLAVAFHFGNYFYAGLVKASLGDSPLYWVMENRTQILVLAGWESGVLPISFIKGLPSLIYETIGDVRVFTNLFTISIQLLAVVAIIRIRWAIWITLGYDLLHLVIFITTGILFWKFMVLNLAIVAALSVIAARRLPGNLRVALASAVVCSPYVFHIMPSFAWLDTPSVNQVRLYALADDGREYRVPSNYFLGSSVTMAQDRMVWPAQGPFPTQTWGTTREVDVAKQGLACDWRQDANALPEASFFIPKAAIETFVRRHHRQILSMADAHGRVDYDIFPHHIFSMPWRFESFKALDKRRIVAYRYEMNSVCLGYAAGRVTRKHRFHATFDIPVR